MLLQRYCPYLIILFKLLATNSAVFAVVSPSLVALLLWHLIVLRAMGTVGSLAHGQAAKHCPNTNTSDDLCDKIFTSFLKNVSDCKYLDLSELNQTKFDFSKPDFLILVHINTRSLTKNFDELYDLLQCLPFTPDIIRLSESRLKPQPQINIDLEGYKFLNISPESNAGGVAMYVRNCIQFNQETSFMLHGSECLWLNLNRT